MKCGNYTLVKPPDNYPGKRYNDNRYCFEHHLVWWINTGETVPEKHVIHHKNGSTRDNKFENLEILSSSNHAKLHRSFGRTMMEITCAFCGKKSKKEKRQIVPKMNNGQKDFYCDRSCMATHFGNGRSK